MTTVTIDPKPCPKCEQFACVCTIQERHKPDCKFRISATCTTPIACEHGYDVCPECDPCTCGAEVATADFGPPQPKGQA